MIFSDDELPDDRIYTSPEAIAAAKAEMERLGAKLVIEKDSFISPWTMLEYKQPLFQEFLIGAYSIELTWNEYLCMDLWVVLDKECDPLHVTETYEFPNKSVKDAFFKALNEKGFLIQETI